MGAPPAAAVLLNHFFVVPDGETYEALRQSTWLRETFGVFEARTTVRRDMTYTGVYFYGRHTYFEFLPPGPAFLEGSSALAFGVEETGAGGRLRARLAAALGERFTETGITRQVDGRDVPWFRMVASEDGTGGERFRTWLMEYEPTFLAEWHPDSLPPPRPAITRAAVLDRYVAKVGPSDARDGRLLDDVTAIRLALGPPDRERLLAQCRLFGYAVEERGATTEGRGPEVRLVLVPGEGGVVEFEITLRRAVDPPAERRFGRSVLALGPGRTARWSFPPAGGKAE